MKKRIKSLTNLSMRVKFIDNCSSVQIVVLNHTTDETFVRVVPLEFSDLDKVSDENSSDNEDNSNDVEEVNSDD